MLTSHNAFSVTEAGSEAASVLCSHGPSPHAALRYSRCLTTLHAGAMSHSHSLPGLEYAL